MKSKRLLWAATAILAVAAVLCGVSVYRSATVLTTVRYELETELTEPIRIV